MGSQSNIGDGLSQSEINSLRTYRFLMVLSFMCSLLFIITFSGLVFQFTKPCQTDNKASIGTGCTLLIFSSSCLIFAILCPCLMIIFEKINQSWCQANEEPEDFEIEMRAYP